MSSSKECIKEKQGSALGVLLLVLIVAPATLFIALLISAYLGTIPTLLGITISLDFLTGNVLVLWIVLVTILGVALVLYVLLPRRKCASAKGRKK
jgi:Gpi18-like mannosyltransferase